MITWQLGGRPPRHPGPAGFEGHPKEAYARPVRLEKSWNHCVPVQMPSAPLPAQRASTRRQNPRVDLSKLDVSRGIFSTSRSSSMCAVRAPPVSTQDHRAFTVVRAGADAAAVPCAGGPCLQPGTAPSCRKHHLSSPVTSQQHKDRSQCLLLQASSLRRYRKHYKLGEAAPGSSKEELMPAVARHFQHHVRGHLL